jgi:hypothetical protein
MIEILATIAGSLTVHLGKKVIDRLWDARRRGGAVANSDGAVVPRTAPVVPVQHWADPVVPVQHWQPDPVVPVQHWQPDPVVPVQHWQPESIPYEYHPAPAIQRVHVNMMLQDTFPPHVLANSVALIMVVDQLTGNTLLFETSPTEVAVVDLQPSTYSFTSFVVDARYPHIDDALLYGLGMPVHGLPDHVNEVHLDNAEDVFELMADAPIEIGPGGESWLRLIVVDTSRYEGLPHTFGEFFAADDAWLTGSWWIEDSFGDGSAQSRSSVDLVQQGAEVSGTATTLFTENGVQWAVQQLVSGSIGNDGRFELSSYQVHILRGPEGARYFADAWFGWVQDRDTVVGESVDAAGRQGQFVMRRQTVTTG